MRNLRHQDARSGDFAPEHRSVHRCPHRLHLTEEGNVRQRGQVTFPGLRRKLETDVPPPSRSSAPLSRAHQGCRVFTELPSTRVPQVRLCPRCPGWLGHTVFHPLRAGSPHARPSIPAEPSLSNDLIYIWEGREDLVQNRVGKGVFQSCGFSAAC